MANSLGPVLRELREKHNYTQDVVGNILNISRQAYSNYERGKRQPDYNSLMKICEFYGITMDELFHYGEPSSVIEEDKSTYPNMSESGTTTLRLSGADARMLKDYKFLPSEVQKEIRSYIRYRRIEFEKESKTDK